MIENPLPTRAEASDVANAVYDGTSAVMLSGETAAGKYPVKTLQTIVEIIEDTEKDIDYQTRFQQAEWDFDRETVNIIGKATTLSSFELGVKAITVSTRSGNTARMISRFRPETPIVAVTVESRISRQLNLSWGVFPVETRFFEGLGALFQELISKTEETGLVQEGDLIIIIAGIPTGVEGKTNMFKVHRMGEDIVHRKKLR